MILASQMLTNARNAVSEIHPSEEKRLNHRQQVVTLIEREIARREQKERNAA